MRHSHITPHISSLNLSCTRTIFPDQSSFPDEDSLILFVLQEFEGDRTTRIDSGRTSEIHPLRPDDALTDLPALLHYLSEDRILVARILSGKTRPKRVPFEDLGDLVWLATTTVISMSSVALSVAGAFHSEFDPVHL